VRERGGDEHDVPVRNTEERCGCEEAAEQLGTTLDAPFMAASFLALSVIPELKITDRGLVDTVNLELVPLEA
jgi:adenine deaminase